LALEGPAGLDAWASFFNSVLLSGFAGLLEIGIFGGDSCISTSGKQLSAFFLGSFSLGTLTTLIILD